MSAGYKKGNFRVTRDCCTSGRCFACQGGPTKRFVQTRDVSEDWAKHVASQWPKHRAWVEVQPL